MRPISFFNREQKQPRQSHHGSMTQQDLKLSQLSQLSQRRSLIYPTLAEEVLTTANYKTRIKPDHSQAGEKRSFSLIQQNPVRSPATVATVATVATILPPTALGNAGFHPSKKPNRPLSFLDGRDWQIKPPKRPEVEIVAWLDANPASLSSIHCAHCADFDRSYDPLGPHGASGSGAAWVHRSCWAAWMACRRAQAIIALGIKEEGQVQSLVPMSTFVFDQMVALFQEAPIPLTQKNDAEAMVAAYQEYSKQNGLPLDQNFIDWGDVPDDFEAEWAKARDLWFTEVSQAAKARELSQSQNS